MNRTKSLKFIWVFTLALSLILALLPVTAAGQTPPAGDYKLTILHTNDTHAHLLPFDKSYATCKPDTECWGGVARRAGLIEQLRAKGGNTLLVDAGDQFQGTLFYNQYKGKEAQEFMNTMGYQAMALGNHEFDDGPGILGEFIKGAKFPVLSANLDVSAEPALAGLVKPWTVVDVGGRKIGVIGLTTEELPTISSPGPNVKPKSATDSAKEAVAALKAEGVNTIVALTHLGYNADQALVAAVDGIDVIVGGHTHTLLSNTDATAAGPYPTVVKSPSGAPVLIVTGDHYGKSLGKLDVTFNADGIPTAWEGEPVPLDKTVPSDPAVAARVAEMFKPLAELAKTPVGESTVDLVGDSKVCRFGECNMGNLITDAMVWASQNDGTQIAFENGGGIRASLPAGQITVGGVLEVLPFGNTLATFGLKGADVRTALENGVSRAENPANEGTGRFAQVSGLRYTWDSTQPAGSRIVSVDVGNAKDGYKPLDPNAVYKLVTNDFNRKGGDDYTVFANNAIDPYDYGQLLADALSDYIKAHSPVSPTVEGRITKQQ